MVDSYCTIILSPLIQLRFYRISEQFNNQSDIQDNGNGILALYGRLSVFLCIGGEFKVHLEELGDGFCWIY